MVIKTVVWKTCVREAVLFIYACVCPIFFTFNLNKFLAQAVRSNN